MTVVKSRYWGVAGFSAAGFALLWWTANQTEEIQKIASSTFQYPRWRMIAALITLIAAGFAFGWAALLARAERSRTDVGLTVLAAAIPLAVIINYVGFFVWGFAGFLHNRIGIFLVTQTTITAACLVVGFLGAGLISRRATTPPVL